MAFVIPTIIGGISAISGFTVGYYYAIPTETKNIELKTFSNINLDNPNPTQVNDYQIKMNNQLINFDKNDLKKIECKENLKVFDDTIMDKIKKKMKQRRNVINVPDELYDIDISDK